MRIVEWLFKKYEIPLTSGGIRSGSLLHVKDAIGRTGIGDLAPFPGRSVETREESELCLEERREEILRIDWTLETCFETLRNLRLFPSASFALESALLSILDPVPAQGPERSALFLGSYEEILRQAEERSREGYRSAKLKISGLSFHEAACLISSLKERFRLRIDVNRAWETEDSLRFFSAFSGDDFEYVEEPFVDPKDLPLFNRPFALDESLVSEESFAEFEALRRWKAVVYKPSVQGGIAHCRGVLEACRKRGIDLVLSSSFESHVGLDHIVKMARRLGLSAPVGVGTVHFLGERVTGPGP